MSAAIKYQPEIKNMWGRFSPDQEFKTLHLPGGVEVGVVQGLLATWDIDEGQDRFHKGAFLGSIAEHKDRGMRQLRISNEHMGLIGGAPIEGVHETSKGLVIEAHINLEHSEGKDVWALIKQGVLVDFSIGYSAVDWEIRDDIREITKALIWHGSTVGEPMNRAAQITAVKSLQARLPIAPEDHEWDSAKAWKRIQESGSQGLACVGVHSVCDIVDGEVTVIPKALQELVESGVHNPEEIRLVEQYYAAMKKASPFDRSERQFFTREDADTITAKELESLFVSTGRLSRKTAKSLVSRMQGLDNGEGVHHSGKSKEVASWIKDLRAARGA